MFRAAESTAARSRDRPGLTIVKAIVDAHGGPIVVESEPDAALAFRVELPFVELDAATHAQSAPDSV